MPDRNMILSLAKVALAAAWADGEVTMQEVNSVKTVLMRLPRSGGKSGPELTAREFAMLEMYARTPVGPEERARLLGELQAEKWTPDERALAIEALTNLIQADGSVTSDEQAVIAEVTAAIDAAAGGNTKSLGRLFGRSVKQVSQTAASAPNRERDLEEFMKNKSYYMIRTRLNEAGVDAGISEAELHKLSTVTGLMARVSRTDPSSSEEEHAAIAQALQSHWPISAEVARIAAEATLSGVSLDTDPLRLAQELLDITTEDERARLIDALFVVAAADGFVSQAELNEIGSIASFLYVPRKAFIESKLKIPASNAPSNSVSLESLLLQLRADRSFMRDVVAWERVPARPGRYAPFPSALDSRLIDALRARGIDQLYTHQAAAIDGALRGESVCVVTSTASGKTLCYNLPVLNTLLREPHATKGAQRPRSISFRRKRWRTINSPR